uniref:Uncharacterized protein n=1 Tax=Oryza brachyantha TaxID=4533 RepID=J3N7R6_ORYBR
MRAKLANVLANNYSVCLIHLDFVDDVARGIKVGGGRWYVIYRASVDFGFGFGQQLMLCFQKDFGLRKQPL